MKADAIDRELDGYPHMLEYIRQIPIEQGSVTVFGPPFLPTADDIHTSTLHRALVQRAIYNTGYTTRVLFMRGDRVIVCMSGEPELHHGMSEVVYVSPDLEATLRDRMAAFDDIAVNECTLCKQIAGKKCGACASYYCSRECQRKDWKRHKFECLDKRKSEERT